MRMLPLAALALCLLGCASVPYGEFDGHRRKFADPDVYDVVVLGVDGKLPVEVQGVVSLTPGTHLLLLTTTKRPVHGEASQQSVAINVEPCVQYAYVAKFKERYSTDEWELVPQGESHVSGCKVATTRPVEKPGS